MLCRKTTASVPFCAMRADKMSIRFLYLSAIVPAWLTLLGNRIKFVVHGFIDKLQLPS